MKTDRRAAGRFVLTATALALAGCGGGGDDAVPLILTAFILTAVVGGVTDGSVSVRPAGHGFLSLEPGVALTINSDLPVTFTVTPKNVSIATPVVTSRSWSTAGVATVVGGQFVLKASLFGDPAVSADLTIVVLP